MEVVVKGEFKGKLIVHRKSANDPNPCGCCDKPHAYTYWAEPVTKIKRPYAGLYVETMDDWVHDKIGEWVRDENTSDNAEVTITIEIKEKKSGN